jgi:hypothetical protein
MLLMGSALTFVKAGEPKMLVDHKGSQICVDLSSVDGHVGHGDPVPTETCE